MKGYITTLDIINGTRFYGQQLLGEQGQEDFDTICDTIFRHVERLIFKCGGSVARAHNILEKEGLEEYMEIYLDVCVL